MNLEQLFQQFKDQNISGRYVHLETINQSIDRLIKLNRVHVLGESVLGAPIYVYKNGTGNKRIMMWSQMHGNESTTTKAVFDLFNFLESDLATDLLEKYTFCVIPMLNPDGAKLWTRNNANDVDLNRDSQNLTQPESKLLRKAINDFKPDFCYNLHDQRTIYGVEGSDKPATISFLSPSFNEAKDINETRALGMSVIAKANRMLQNYIPGQVGLYDDSFNINCIGDTVQNLGIPTILIEAGHYPDDYQREKTREFVFYVLIETLNTINENSNENDLVYEYFNISRNICVFFDVICKNLQFNYDNKQIFTNFAIQFSEKIINNKLHFEPIIAKIEKLEGYYSHYCFDLSNQPLLKEHPNSLEIGKKVDFLLDDCWKIERGLL